MSILELDKIFLGTCERLREGHYLVLEAEEGTPPHQKLFQNRKYFSDHSYDLFTSFFKVVLRIEPDPSINFVWGSRCY